MRNLNKEELDIVTKKTKRVGRKLPVIGIEYRMAFPRTTLCLLRVEESFDGNCYADLVVGVSMRAKYEHDIPAIGEIVAFTRALNMI